MALILLQASSTMELVGTEQRHLISDVNGRYAQDQYLPDGQIQSCNWRGHAIGWPVMMVFSLLLVYLSCTSLETSSW